MDFRFSLIVRKLRNDNEYYSLLEFRRECLIICRKMFKMGIKLNETGKNLIRTSVSVMFRILDQENKRRTRRVLKFSSNKVGQKTLTEDRALEKKKHVCRQIKRSLSKNVNFFSLLRKCLFHRCSKLFRFVRPTATSSTIGKLRRNYDTGRRRAAARCKMETVPLRKYRQRKILRQRPAHDDVDAIFQRTPIRRKRIPNFSSHNDSVLFI